jgi:hypothetical protein
MLRFNTGYQPMAAHAEHYTSNDVQAITGISVPRQSQLLDRGVIVASRADKRPSGRGDPRLNSLATVYQFAIMAEGERLNVPGRLAAYAARLFTDQPSHGRPAGKLFDRGRSVLVIRPTGPVLVNVDPDADFSALADFEASFTAINVNAVVKRVNELLLTLKD